MSRMTGELTLRAANSEFSFAVFELPVPRARQRDIFARKNNKTVGDTLAHRRYASLAADIRTRYLDRLGEPLGRFLLSLKRAGDTTYRRFLNPYGDLEYCTFQVPDTCLTRVTGVYLFRIDQEIAYVGRSRDPFRKRMNQGYGTIHPKNCYLDGQATNCHLNARIAALDRDHVELAMCPIEGDAAIIAAERALLETLRPKWNLRR